MGPADDRADPFDAPFRVLQRFDVFPVRGIPCPYERTAKFYVTGVKRIGDVVILEVTHFKIGTDLNEKHDAPHDYDTVSLLLNDDHKHVASEAFLNADFVDVSRGLGKDTSPTSHDGLHVFAVRFDNRSGAAVPHWGFRHCVDPANCEFVTLPSFIREVDVPAADITYDDEPPSEGVMYLPHSDAGISGAMAACMGTSSSNYFEEGVKAPDAIVPGANVDAYKDYLLSWLPSSVDGKGLFRARVHHADDDPESDASYAAYLRRAAHMSAMAAKYVEDTEKAAAAAADVVTQNSGAMENVEEDGHDSE